MNDPEWESFYWSTFMIQGRFEDRVKGAVHRVKWKPQCVQQEFYSVCAQLETKLHTTKKNTRKGDRSSFIKVFEQQESETFIVKSSKSIRGYALLFLKSA